MFLIPFLALFFAVAAALPPLLLADSLFIGSSCAHTTHEHCDDANIFIFNYSTPNTANAYDLHVFLFAFVVY